jgi:uncharacterized protein
MGERTEYTPGTFSWADLSTTDPEAAKRFYSELFGWETDDRPVTGGGTYTMASLGGRYVAGLAGQPPDQQAAGVPPLWNSYVTVEDVDAAARRVVELGGHVHAGPFDVERAGRMAVAQDPQGAFFMLWEPRDHIGAGLVNAPGALCWNQLTTTDIGAAQAFYGALFGWAMDALEESRLPYWMIRNDEVLNGGLMAQPPAQDGAPPSWLVVFAVEDLDASLGDVERLGGRTLSPVTEMEFGRFAAVSDPQGAVFALFAGELDA